MLPYKVKTRKRLIFHRKESEYYILEDNLEDKGIHKLYNILSDKNNNSFIPLRDFFTEDINKKEYRDIYYIFTKMIKLDKTHDKTKKEFLYGQKIGKFWYIINNLV